FAGPLRFELLAPVGALPERGVAGRVDQAVVVGVDADLREVERPGVEAIDARPVVAVVARDVDTVGLEAFEPLFVLDVGALPANLRADEIRALRVGSGPVAAAFANLTGAER